MPQDIARRIKQAECAREYMLGADMREYEYILLIPCTDEPFCRSILTAFEARLNGRKGKVLAGESTREILSLYSLYHFTDKLIIGSLDLPYGRKLRNLLDSGIATEDELIHDVILGAM